LKARIVGKGALLPNSLEDYVTADNPVRVIDVFIDELDLGALGFAGVVPEVTGRPAYHPATPLKIYLYGYFNRIQSSRRLKRETQRNIELMWLTGRLVPDFKAVNNHEKKLHGGQGRQAHRTGGGQHRTLVVPENWIWGSCSPAGS